MTGQTISEFSYTDDGTPETPTRTPLPIGHDPFEMTYVVTERGVRRDGITVECW